MVRLALVRPGATDYDCQGRIQGTLDIPLCDDGRGQIALLAEQLRDQRLEAIYSARCQAAQETAAELARLLDLRWRRLDKLTNTDLGLWQGMLIDDVKRKHPKVYRQWQEQPEAVCPPNGETLAETRQRAASVLDWIAKKHRGGVVALVAPEPLAGVLRWALGGEPIREPLGQSDHAAACVWIEAGHAQAGRVAAS